MSTEFIKKWEQILEDVEKQKIPLEFIKKLVIKLEGKKQKTFNVSRFFNEGLTPEEVEEILARQLTEYEDVIVSMEFVLNVESIANTVQPETDRLLYKL